jgi:hypothetical protein
VLAVSALGLAALLSKRSLGVRLSAALPLAWIAGFASWIPFSRSVLHASWLESLTWPLLERWDTVLLWPVMAFGLVALVYYLALTLFCARPRSLATHLLCAGAGGVLGSLYWWISFEQWYYSLLHGAIWGACVGTGAWSASRGLRAGLKASIT